MVLLLCCSPQEENPGDLLKGICCDRCPSSPSGMCNTLRIPWQIGPPQDQVHICCPGGLSGRCILPLSTLVPQHGGTSCAVLPPGGEFKDPTGVFIQEEFQIHLPLQFSNRDPCFSGSLPSHPASPNMVSIV